MEHAPVAATEEPAQGERDTRPGASRPLRTRIAAVRPSTPEGWLQAAALATLAISLSIAAVRALQAGWIPVGDEALIEMHVRDVPAHFPLLGVYSRFGWSHPGPAQFLALALPYRLLGSSSAALLARALAGHLLVIAVAWWIARRIDRLAGIAVLVALELVLLGVPADLVRSAWNPYVALSMAGLMVVVAWGVTEREPLATALALPIGSFLVQSHIGNLPLVVMTLAVALPLMWWTHGAGSAVPALSADGPPHTARAVPWRAAALGLALAAVMWIPALVDQVTADEGNVTRIIRDLSRDESRVGLGAAAGASSGFFGWWPAWTDQHSLLLQLAGTGRVVPVWLALPAVALLVAWRRQDRTFLRALAVGAAGVVSTVVAAASIKGVFFSYLVVGHRSIVAIVMAISVAAIARGAPERFRQPLRVGLAAVAVVAAGAIGVFQWSAHNPSVPFAATVRAVTESVEQVADGSPVFITSAGDDPSRDVASGLLLQLERAGVKATTVRGEDWRMGAHRTSDGSGAVQVKIVPVGEEQTLLDEGFRILLEYQPMDPAEAAEVDRLVAERNEAIREGEAAGPDDPGAAARFATIQDLADRIDEVRAGRIATVVGVKD